MEGMTDLAALATLADCMPLNPLNRELVREGIALMKSRPRSGLARLFSRLGQTSQALSEESLTMKVIPCLNAAGRMDLADTAVGVLHGRSGAEQKVETLLSLNKKRQVLSGRISGEAEELLSGSFSHVALGESWRWGFSAACKQAVQHEIVAGGAGRPCPGRHPGHFESPGGRRRHEGSRSHFLPSGCMGRAPVRRRLFRGQG
jgi:single-stranded-DNA-specific exonuclease